MQRLTSINKIATPATAQRNRPFSLILFLVRTFAAVNVPQAGPRLDKNDEPRFLEQVKLFYNSAAAKTGIDPQYLRMIQSCNSVIRFNIPLRRDNGDLDTVTCYRA